MSSEKAHGRAMLLAFVVALAPLLPWAPRDTRVRARRLPGAEGLSGGEG
ncbi:MAG: hypothetical protein ACJ754_18310 [Pyrinomonadaceae bacterium]